MVQPTFLPKLTKFVARFGTLPTSYRDAMTYEEQILWICNYIENTLLPALNQNSEALEELQGLFIQLKDYVDNYFENLDVQEEINNKIDDMIESGQFEEILRQILANSQKVYDNVAEMKADTQIQNGDRISCYGYLTKGDKGNGLYIVTNEDLTPNDLTIIELDNGLFAKLLYKDSVFVVDTTILTDELAAELLNNGISILSNEYLKFNDSIEISNDNVTLKNMKLDGNNIVECVLKLTGKNITISNCKFQGKCGEYIRALGTNQTIAYNTFNSTNASVIHPVYVAGEYITVNDNKFINSSGFNIQVLFAKKVNITNNIFDNHNLSLDYVAQGGETVVQFEATEEQKRYTNRKIVRKNGSIISATVTTDDEHIIITLSEALTEGDTINFRGYKTLEPININSNSYDITVTNNIIGASGDAGIVIGSDYHDGVLDPSHTVATDFPSRIDIIGNTITNTAYSGIALNNPCTRVTINNNNITNTAWLVNGVDVYNSGISLAKSYDLVVTNNNISNIVVSDGRNETENGVMEAGIALSPDTVATANTSAKMNANQMIIKNNIVKNTNRKLRLFSNYNGYMQIAPYVDIDNETIMTITNATSGNNNIVIGVNATASLDTTESYLSENSIKVQFPDGGSYISFNPRGMGKMPQGDNIVEICFWAKCSGGGYARVLENRSNISVVNNYEEEITDTWKQYKLRFNISATTSLFQLRFQRKAAGDIVYISNVQFKVYHID